MRRIAVVLLLASGCSFAVRHPAVTTGIVAGAVAESLCALNASDQLKCAEIAAAAGVGLGLIAGGALWLGGASDPGAPPPPPPVDWSKIPDTTPAPTAPPPAPPAPPAP